MVVGSGMIGRAFKHYENDDRVVIFASGVSNSLEISQENFMREVRLLENVLQDHPDKTLVYFSTCSVYDQNHAPTQYIIHKMRIENMIAKLSSSYLILRLPQVVGRTTSPTLINYLFNKIKNGEKFDLQMRSFRNLIDIEDVFKISKTLLESNFINEVFNLAGPRNIAVSEIVTFIEKLTSATAVYEIKDSGSEYHFETKACEDIASSMGISLNGDYPFRIISKYYK